MTVEERKEYRRKYHIENRDRELQQMKEYRENNKDAVREMQRNWRENNPEALKAYKRKYYKENTRDAVYMLMNKDEEVLYVGSTRNLYKRINQRHLCGCSNLHLDKDRIKGLNCSRFDYAYIDGLDNKLELRYIEQIFINKFNPILNIKNALHEKKFSEIDDSRKYGLELIVDNLIFKVWKEI